MDLSFWHLMARKNWQLMNTTTSWKCRCKIELIELWTICVIKFKVDCTKNDIRKVVADLPMDKHYKIMIKDFIKVPILSDDVFKAMDKNNDGEVSKVTQPSLLFNQEFNNILRGSWNWQKSISPWNRSNQLCQSWTTMEMVQ